MNPITGTYEYRDDSEQYASGMLELTLAEDELQQDDNITLGIANYFEPKSPDEKEPVPEEGEWF